MAVTGTWGIGGYKLPDFGLTEKIANPGNNTFYNPQVNYSKGQSSAGFQSGFNGGGVAGGGGGGALTNQTGQVQGLSTYGGSGGGGASTGATAQQPQQQQNFQAQVDNSRGRMEGLISSGFDSIVNNLSNLKNQYMTYQNEDLGRLGQQANNLRSTAQSVYNTNKDQLETYRTDVTNRAKESMTSLADNLRNALMAGNIMLGSRGAGDSSASDMMSYALSKQANRSNAEILRGRDSQFGELDRKFMDLKTAFDTQNQEIDTWEFSSGQQIRDNVRSILERIENAKMGADQSRMQALVRLEEGIMSQAQANLDRIANEASSMRMMAYQNALNAGNSLGQNVNRFNDIGSYNVQDIGYTNIDPTMNMAGTTGGPQAYVGTNPFMRREEERRMPLA